MGSNGNAYDFPRRLDRGWAQYNIYINNQYNFDISQTIWLLKNDNIKCVIKIFRYALEYFDSNCMQYIRRFCEMFI
jgi:hypothetical protein